MLRRLTKPQKSLLAHRVDLHTQLKNTAISDSGAGTPVNLVTGARVVDIDIEGHTITLEDGSSFSGDMVIGADGVHVRDCCWCARPIYTDRLVKSPGRVRS